jgi:hypothetical protein
MNKSLVKGIFLGGILGAGVAIFAVQFTFIKENMEINEWISMIFLAVFGHEFLNHTISVLVCFGIIIGAAIGGFRGWMLFRQKKWLGILSFFIAGILIGSMAAFFVVAKLAERAVTISEYNSSQQEAQAFLVCLKAIDRGTTNNFSRFQLDGRMVLSNYVQGIQKIKNEDYVSMFTNSLTYERAQEYLTQHPASTNFP